MKFQVNHTESLILHHSIFASLISRHISTQETYPALTATEKRHFLIQLPLVFAQYLFQDEIHDRIFSLYLSLVKWYELARRPELSESGILEMDAAWEQCVTNMFFIHS